MHDTLQALLGLQETDRKIFRVEAELRRLPAELEKRQAELADSERALDERKAALVAVRARIKEIEDITTQQRQRTRKLEGEASKSKADGALLAAYDHEIRTLKRTVGQAEEDGLALVGQADELESEIEERKSALEDSRSTFDEFRGNVEKEVSEAESRLAELNASQTARSSGEISAEHLALYRRILETREGEAMAELSGQICQACFVEIPKNVAVRLAAGSSSCSVRPATGSCTCTEPRSLRALEPVRDGRPGR